MDADRRACCDPDVAAHYGIGAAEVTGAERCSLILRTRLWFSIEICKAGVMGPGSKPKAAAAVEASLNTPIRL